MQQFLTGWCIALVTGLALVAGGCGGGGGGGGGAPQALEISGTALEPTGSPERLLSQVGAVLRPVSGSTVELIEVDALGVQVGDVLATSLTSTTGAYTLVLPDGLSLSAMLMVRVTGTTGTMRGLVVSKTVDITPASEYVARKLTSNGNTLDRVTPNEVLTISGYIEEFDLSDAASIDEMIALLDGAAGPSLQPLLDLAQQGPGNSADIAGSLFLAAFDMPMADFPETRFNTETFDATITGGADGKATLTDLDGTDSAASLWATDNGTGGISYGFDTNFDLDQNSPNLPIQVSADGSFTVLVPLEEEIFAPGEGGFPGGNRRPANAITFCPVGDGLYASAGYSEELEYETTADGKAIDLSKQRGHIREPNLFLAVKQGAIANASLDGATFGVVSLGSYMDVTGLRTLFSEIGTVDFSSKTSTNGAITTSLSEFELRRVPNGVDRGASLSWSATGKGNDDPEGTFESLEIPYVLNPSTGGITLAPGTGDASVANVTTSGQFLVLPLDSGDDSEAERGVLTGIRLGTANPSISARSYKVLLLERGMSASGWSQVSRLLGTTMTFSGIADANVSGTVSDVNRENDFGDSVKTRTEVIDVNGTFSFPGTNGSCSINLDGTVLTGFMNATGSAGIFQVRNSNLGLMADGEATLGIVILIEQVEP